MVAILMQSLFAAVTHGAVVVPLLWIIGVVLLIAGVVALVRGGILAGIVLIILGIILGGLNVL
jgi:hypothetical protein